MALNSCRACWEELVSIAPSIGANFSFMCSDFYCWAIDLSGSNLSWSPRHCAGIRRALAFGWSWHLISLSAGWHLPPQRRPSPQPGEPCVQTCNHLTHISILRALCGCTSPAHTLVHPHIFRVTQAPVSAHTMLCSWLCSCTPCMCNLLCSHTPAAGRPCTLQGPVTAVLTPWSPMGSWGR